MPSGRCSRRSERPRSSPRRPSPFTAALKGAQGTIDELQKEIETTYRVPLTG